MKNTPLYLNENSFVVYRFALIFSFIKGAGLALMINFIGLWKKYQLNFDNYIESKFFSLT